MQKIKEFDAYCTNTIIPYTQIEAAGISIKQKGRKSIKELMAYPEVKREVLEGLDNKNCYSELDGYYLDISIWKKCASNCATCDGGNMNQCLSCALGYYFKEEDLTGAISAHTCYNSDTIDSNYYLDSIVNNSILQTA